MFRKHVLPALIGITAGALLAAFCAGWVAVP